MLSYHRVLKVFGRSVKDKTLECDCDIHPWEITVNSETWPGKIRLIGFVDVFFIISYSANDRFMRGIIIYKDPTALGVLKKRKEENEKAQEAQKEPKEQHQEDEKNEQRLGDESTNEDSTESSQPVGVEDTDVEPDDHYEYYHGSSDSEFDSDSTDEDNNNNNNTDPKKEENIFKFKERSVYTIRSLGHEIFLKAALPTSSIKVYTVEINRPVSWAMSRRMKRALKSHGIGRMMQDAVRCGLITQGQLIGHTMGTLFTGGRFTDTLSRAFQETSGDGAQRQALSNEKL
ncbi:hypothetical protein AAE478_004907 [Parahypoxylon ruwenzoriense]